MAVARSHSPETILLTREVTEPVQPKGRVFSSPAVAMNQTSAIQGQDRDSYSVSKSRW